MLIISPPSLPPPVPLIYLPIKMGEKNEQYATHHTKQGGCKVSSINKISNGSTLYFTYLEGNNTRVSLFCNILVPKKPKF